MDDKEIALQLTMKILDRLNVTLIDDINYFEKADTYAEVMAKTYNTILETISKK